MNASKPTITTGRALLTLIALSCSISCYIADFNETHVYNPRWPRHAKFHNGQTMSFGLYLGLLTQYFIWRPVLFGNDPMDSLWCAALTGSAYWITGMSAVLYPGAEGVDPEFGSGNPQIPLFGAHLAIVWLGYFLERRRLLQAGEKTDAQKTK